MGRDWTDFFDTIKAERNQPPPSSNGTQRPGPDHPLVNGHGENPAYVEAALRRECAELAAMGPNTGRNHKLNAAGWALARYVNAGALDQETVETALLVAAATCGVLAEDGEAVCLRSIRSGLTRTDIKHPPPPHQHEPNVTEVNDQEPGGGDKQPCGRVVTWKLGSDIDPALPVWAWEHSGRGRIQVGTLALLAGRPGAGKSTAARWFAAQATLGRLEGCWHGQPQNVAYIATEESAQYVIIPGLIAARADMARVHFPHVTRDGETTALLGLLDEAQLLAYILANKITVIIVDPLMSTVTATTDINRNNEMRNQIAPWARIADRAGGITLGVVHLRKNASGDVVAAITGSSAFGEVARAVFGFAKNIEADTRVMSQHKNSVGHEDLALTYEIASTPVEMPDGVAEVGAFRILGDSEVTVEDILSDSAMNSGGAALECQRWLQDYVSAEGPCPSKDVKATAYKEGGWSHATVEKAARKLRVHVESRGFPRRTYWSLPSDLPVASEIGRR